MFAYMHDKHILYWLCLQKDDERIKGKTSLEISKLENYGNKKIQFFFQKIYRNIATPVIIITCLLFYDDDDDNPLLLQFHLYSYLFLVSSVLLFQSLFHFSP